MFLNVNSSLQMLWSCPLGVQNAKSVSCSPPHKRDRIRVERAQTLKHLFNEWPDPQMTCKFHGSTDDLLEFHPLSFRRAQLAKNLSTWNLETWKRNELIHRSDIAWISFLLLRWHSINGNLGGTENNLKQERNNFSCDLACGLGPRNECCCCEHPIA